MIEADVFECLLDKERIDKLHKKLMTQLSETKRKLV